SSDNTTVNLGNAVNGVQDIHKPVYVRNTSSSTTLNVDDRADRTYRRVTLDTSGPDYLGLTGLAPAPISYGGADGISLTVILATTSNYGKGFYVNQTGRRGSTTLNLGNRTDAVEAHATSGPLTCHGGNSINSLFAWRTGGSTTNTWNITGHNAGTLTGPS